MSTSERNRAEPKVDWVSTGAGGKNEDWNASTDENPGQGANDITRAGFPNADPDGYDYERSDLKGIDIGDSPIADDK